MIRLKAEKTPYSSIVGGGLTLKNDAGRLAFVVSIIGTTQGITKQEDAEISARLVELINKHGLEVSERQAEPADFSRG